MNKIIVVLLLMGVSIQSSLGSNALPQAAEPLSDSLGKATEQDRWITVYLKGMVCDFCARGLEKSFGKRKEVAGISVSLEKGKINVHLEAGKNLSDKTITKIITNNGYNVVKIERSKAVQAKKDEAI